MSDAKYDAEDLRLFAQIYTAGSLSAAERRFSVPKSTLSRSLARLEEAAGCALFDRVHRGLKPTSLADELIGIGQTADAAVKNAEEVLRGATAEPSGKLVIAASATSSRFLLSTVLAQFYALYPAVEVRLRVTGDAPDPQAEGIDLTVQAERPDNPSLIARQIISGLSGLYVSGDADPQNWDELAARGRIVVVARDTPQQWREVWLLQNGGEEFIMDDPARIYVGDPSMALDLIASGNGVSLLPNFFAAPLEEAGQIRRAMPDWHGPPLDVFAVFPPGRRKVAAVRRFMDLLVEDAVQRKKESDRIQSKLRGAPSK